MIYSERLDLFTILGGALVLPGNLLNLNRRSAFQRVGT
jgi:hypothetical protein